MPNQPVEQTITLDFTGSGTKEIQDFVTGHEQAWQRIAQHAGQVESHVSGIARSIGGLAGVVGLGALISDFSKLEASANQAALAIGNVTGAQSQWAGLSRGLLGLQAQYGINPQAAAQGITNATGLAGGSYTTQQALGLAREMGIIGLGTGLDVGFLGQMVGQFAQAGNLSATAAAGQLPSVMATLGQRFQGPALGEQLQTTAGVSQMFAARYPFGPGQGQIANQVSGMQVAASEQNRIYNSPGVFSGAMSSISGGFTSALSNPAAASLLMRSGLTVNDLISGQVHPQELSSIRSTLDSIYGSGGMGTPSGNIKYMTLMSMFGVDGANYIMGVGGKTDPASASQTQAWTNRTGQAAAGTMTTLPNELQRYRGQFEQGVQNPFMAGQGALTGGGSGGILGLVAQNPLLALGGYMGGKTLLRGGWKLGSRLLGGGADAAAGADAAVAGDAALGAGEVAGAGGLAALAPEAAIMAGVPLAALGYAHSLFGFNPLGIFGSSHGPSQQAIHAADAAMNQRYQTGRVGQGQRTLTQLYGQNWWSNPKASGYINSMYMGHESPAMEKVTGDSQVGKALLGIISQNKHQEQLYSQLGAQGYWSLQFGKAVTQFEQAVAKMGHDGATGASYTGGSSAQMASFLGAPGAAALGASAPGFELAAFYGGGGGGGGGGSPYVSFLTGGGGGGSSASGGSTGAVGGAPTGGGWQACLLTWYDPALGGINSSGGVANPHASMANGQPYEPNAFTCAAPPNYAFGTKIEFAANGKTITCTVTDRGGAIQGAHFDLTRGASAALNGGGPGTINGRFRVAGGGASGGGSKSGGGGGLVKDMQIGHGASGGAARAAMASLAGSHGGVSSSGGPGTGNVTHVHVHIDGHETHRRRVLTRG